MPSAALVTRAWRLPALVGLLVLGLGCQTPEAPEPPVASAPLSTELDDALVGKWELVSGGKATLNLEEGGKMTIRTEANTPSGPIKGEVSGTWSATGGVFSTRRKSPDGLFFTAEYSYKIENEKLRLVRKGSKVEQEYKKAKS